MCAGLQPEKEYGDQPHQPLPTPGLLKYATWCSNSMTMKLKLILSSKKWCILFTDTEIKYKKKGERKISS